MNRRRVASCAVVTRPGQPLKKRDANPIGVEAIHVSRPGIHPGGQCHRFREEVDTKAGQVGVDRLEISDVKGEVNSSRIGCLDIEGLTMRFENLDQFEHWFGGPAWTKERHADVGPFIPQDETKVRAVTFLSPEEFESKEFLVKVEAVLEVPYGNPDMVPTTNCGGELQMISLHFVGILTRYLWSLLNRLAPMAQGLVPSLERDAAFTGSARS